MYDFKPKRGVLLTLATLALACAFGLPSPAAAADARVRITTPMGDVVVVLDEKHAPKTVSNFLHYVDGGFYNGGTFFRAIPGFVIQGGNRPREKPTDTKIVLETPASTGLLNKDGAISMARTSDPNSATSEFFICDGDQPSLDGSATGPGYAVFGHVVSGMDVVRKIARLPADNQMLVNQIKIVKISRIR